MKKNVIGLRVAENVTGPLGPDSSGLEPSAGGHSRIGSVDEVNGEGALEFPDFVATRAEIHHVAKHWLRTYYDINFDCWLYEYSGSREWRVHLYTKRRLSRIAEMLGDEFVDRARNEVVKELEKNDPEAWAMFVSRTKLLRDASGMPILDANGKLTPEPAQDVPEPQ